jgi:hypothetical protein
VAGVEAIVQRGEILIEAKERLDHGQWQILCKGLPFSQRHAHRLRAIAGDPVLSNQTRMSILPNALSILYMLSKLDAVVVDAAMADGRIHPRMTLADARAMGRGEATPNGGESQQGHARTPKPWTLAGALLKIDRAIAGAPPSEFQALAEGLRDRAHMLDRRPGGASRASRAAPGEQLRDDLAVTVIDVITLGYRAAARKFHPDAGGDDTAMKNVNLAMQWLRAQVGGLGPR